nr:zinc finger, CCHC-type [Tanacetum cinerariifolium]
MNQVASGLNMQNKATSLYDGSFQDKPKQVYTKVPPQALVAHAAWFKGSKEIAALILITMDLDIQRNLTYLGAYDMLQELKTMFAQQEEHELLQTVREFHACKQEEGQSISLYVLMMKSYIDNLERLGQPVSMEKTVNELHAMLKLHEQTLPKKDVTPALHAIRAERGQKNQKKKPHKAAKGNQGKGKAKIGYAPVPALSFAPKPNNPPPPKKENPAKDAICHQFSRLYDDGYVNRFMNNTILVSKNNMVYFSAILRDGIFEINLSNSNTNDSSIYVVSNKRAELNLDSALLWHCRLGHISKKCIEKLQHDGLLNSTDLRAFEKYVSCMSRKMARKPYTHQVERAKDLLGLIHIDVCGPFRTVSRQGASYFVTFTNYFSRYGYVYLLKLKHKVFETIKVFQNEKENQLVKTIKSLCSDRGGDYMSQEFLDHLKEHGIIAHRTPPYMLQHNVFQKEKENQLGKTIKLLHSDGGGYPKETIGYSFYYPLENTVFVSWNAEFFKKSLITQEASGSLEDLEIIQEEDTQVSIDTSLHHDKDDQEINEPQSDINPIRKSTRTFRAPDRICLHVDAEEHELGDLGEPANYEAVLLDPEFDKWLDAMNVETQFIKDNVVWDLVTLPPNGKIVGSKWFFKKKTDME